MMIKISEPTGLIVTDFVSIAVIVDDIYKETFATVTAFTYNINIFELNGFYNDIILSMIIKNQ